MYILKSKAQIKYLVKDDILHQVFFIALEFVHTVTISCGPTGLGRVKTSFQFVLCLKFSNLLETITLLLNTRST